jgi:uncharacterized protein
MAQRVKMIDGMRGFSLLGILIANMLIFQYGIFGKDKIEQFQLSTVNEVAYVWIKVFVEHSFIPIFMFLFGYSMIKLKEKLERNGQKVKRHFVRRFLLLIAFGLLHSIFVWEGDILLTYGSIGLLMLLFLNRKKKTLLIWALLLGLIASLLSYGSYTQTAAEEKQMTSYIQKANQIYANGSYIDIYEFRNSGEFPYDIPDYLYLIIILILPLAVAPMFLLGMYAAKSEWFTNPKRERKKYTLFSLLFLPLGIALKSLLYLFPDSPWSGTAYELGAYFLAIGYIFSFATLYTKEDPGLLPLFEKAGHLSMTNYLVQSMICTTIFYGYGLGFFGKIGVLYGFLLAVAIYGLQLLTTHYYLKIWKMGPFEKLMRIGTYFTWDGTPKIKMNLKQIEKSI